jgi:hypothetical protein
MSKNFSEKYAGIKPKAIQIKSIDEDLRNGLWNIFHKVLFSELRYLFWERDTEYDFDAFWEMLFDSFLKKRIDEIPSYLSGKESFFKRLLLETKWHFTYDLVEFTIYFFRGYSGGIKICQYGDFIKMVNEVLERENSGYRIISDKIAPIIDDIEIETFEKAVSLDEPAATHLKNALTKLSDRKEPDYKNSIKESISAVESVLKKLTGESTLGKALKKLENFCVIPELLKKAMEKLYAYTNGGDGIRHSSIGIGKEPKFEEAKYMLVVCSAFINYIRCKRKLS